MVLHINEVQETDQTRIKRKKKARIQWNHLNAGSNEKAPPIYEENLTLDDEALLLPVDYFRRFFPGEILGEIAHQSNLYALQKNPNKALNLTISELEQWLGISMRMSLCKLSNTRHHWSADTIDESISSIMSRQRWEDIKTNFHLVDNDSINQNDKLAKVRYLVDHLRCEFKKIPMTEHLSIDEQIVPFKGKSSMKQYIPKKPHKWGYKIFILADHKGMVYDFVPFEGKIPAVSRDGIPDLGPSSNAVLLLAESIPENKNHKLYIDNWFTSLPLISHLATRGIWICGTVQARRLPSLEFKNDKQLAKEGRGSFDEHEAEHEGTTVTVVKWYDNRAVCLASSFATSAPTGRIRRYDKKAKDYTDVSIPNIVKIYNEHMGGVDLHDQLMAYCRMSFRNKKYYMRLVFHLFDMTVVNCWFLYRRAADQLKIKQRSQNSLSEFKCRLSRSLMISGKRTGAKRGRLSSVKNDHERKKQKGRATKPIPGIDIRHDDIGHFPIFSDTRGVCKLPGCKGRILVFCSKCKVHLCFERNRNCFLKFHNE